MAHYSPVFVSAVLFPPVPTLSCALGSPQLNLTSNESNEMYYQGLGVLNTPRVYHLDGGCLDLQNNTAFEVIMFVIMRPFTLFE